MSAVTVRAAVVADAAAIAAVHVASWRGAYRGIVPDRVLDALDVERRAEGWRAGLRDSPDGDLVAVALLDGRVLGFVRAGATDSDRATGEVHAIYVDPPMWGRGMGSALLDFAERGLVGRGMSRGRLWAFAANQRALGWYESKGWVHDGTQRVIDLDGSPVPAVRYVKELPAAVR